MPAPDLLSTWSQGNPPPPSSLLGLLGPLPVPFQLSLCPREPVSSPSLNTSATILRRTIRPSASKLEPRGSRTSCSLPLVSRYWNPLGISTAFLKRPGTAIGVYPTLQILPATRKIFFSPVADHPNITMNETTPSPSPTPATKPSPSSNPISAVSAGSKRKRTAVGKYYAVKKGFQPGIYYEWNDCLTQVTGYKGAVCEWCLFPKTSRSHLLIMSPSPSLL